MAVIVTSLDRAEMSDEVASAFKSNTWLWIEQSDGTLHLVVDRDAGPIELPDAIAARMALDVTRCADSRVCWAVLWVLRWGKRQRARLLHR